MTRIQSRNPCPTIFGHDVAKPEPTAQDIHGGRVIAFVINAQDMPNLVPKYGAPRILERITTHIEAQAWGRMHSHSRMCQPTFRAVTSNMEGNCSASVAVGCCVPLHAQTCRAPSLPTHCAICATWGLARAPKRPPHILSLLTSSLGTISVVRCHRNRHDATSPRVYVVSDTSVLSRLLRIEVQMHGYDPLAGIALAITANTVLHIYAWISTRIDIRGLLMAIQPRSRAICNSPTRAAFCMPPTLPPGTRRRQVLGTRAATSSATTALLLDIGSLTIAAESQRFQYMSRIAQGPSIAPAGISFRQCGLREEGSATPVLIKRARSSLRLDG